jgi:outer membrane protein
MRCSLSLGTIAMLASGASLLAQGPPPVDVLTLDQAVSLGLQQNRSIKRGELEVQKAEDSLAVLRTKRRPAFDVTFLEGRLLADINLAFPGGAFGVFPGIGPVPAAETTVTTPAQWTSTTWVRVTQPLSQLHQIALGEHQLELGRDIAVERMRGEEQGVTNNIRRLYFGMLQIGDGLAARTKSLALHQEVDRLVGGYIKEGAALAVDQLEVQALIAKEQLELQAMRDSLASLGEQLNVLIGRDLATPFSVAAVPSDPSIDDDLPALESRALSARPEIKQATLAMGQAQDEVRLKRAALIPDVSATFNYLGFYRYEVLPPAVAMAGVVATWEPFDWGRKRREIAQSEKAVEQAGSATHDTEALVRAEVRSSFRKLRQAREGIRVSELGVEAARERLRVTTSLYREQKTLLREVLQAEAALAAADQLHDDALLQLGTARADLEKAVGGT